MVAKSWPVAGPACGRVVLRHAEVHEHLCRAATGDGKALAVDVNLVGRTCGTVRPRRVLDERAPRVAYLARLRIPDRPESSEQESLRRTHPLRARTRRWVGRLSRSAWIYEAVTVAIGGRGDGHASDRRDDVLPQFVGTAATRQSHEQRAQLRTPCGRRACGSTTGFAGFAWGRAWSRVRAQWVLGGCKEKEC